MLTIQSLPLRDLIPRATAFSKEMINYNIWGQTALMISRLKVRREHYQSLASAVMQAIEVLDQELEKLRSQKEAMKRAESFYEEVGRQMDSKRVERDDLKRDISELSKKPGVAKAAKSVSQLLAGRTQIASSRLPASTPIPRFRTENEDSEDRELLSRVGRRQLESSDEEEFDDESNEDILKFDVSAATAAAEPASATRSEPCEDQNKIGTGSEMADV